MSLPCRGRTPLPYVRLPSPYSRLALSAWIYWNQQALPYRSGRIFTEGFRGQAHRRRSRTGLCSRFLPYGFSRHTLRRITKPCGMLPYRAERHLTLMRRLLLPYGRAILCSLRVALFQGAGLAWGGCRMQRWRGISRSQGSGAGYPLWCVRWMRVCLPYRSF